ncbi:exonuclease SbcCD, C subunit [Reticulomyxa filosa]|uniref:Exonuclease SbcCD, C subunit n=1 Tax=Reticulomyxa filosa TaxID=46433 RepID=X6PF49_RETFI|nr:exonuclease SbcCD, C subunit [Reticulomyxa filosa]|eukprot:ETO36302.1 exonuclease SbcCD, C subunit [Reticulomyxa filosa]
MMKMEKKQTENRSVVPLRQETANTFNLVEEFLQKYSIFVQNQLNSLNLTEGTAIPSNKDDVDNDDNRDMIEKSKKLEKGYSTIFAYFPLDIIEQFEKRLKRIHLNLSDEIRRLTAVETNTKQLKKKIAIARTLSELDEFIQNSNFKFRNLFEKHQTRIYNAEADIEPAVDNSDKKKALNDIEALLSNALYVLAKKIKVLPLEENETNIKNMDELRNNLEHMKRSTKICHQIFATTIEKVKSDIEKNMDREFKKIDKLMDTLNFLEIQQKISFIQKMVEIVRDYCEPISLKSKDMKEGQEKHEKRVTTSMGRVNEHKEKIEKKLGETVDHFKGTKLSEYKSLKPSEVHAKLIAAKYENEWKRIEDDIIKKIQDQLETTCNNMENVSSKQTQTYIQLCKTVVAILRDHMKEMLDKDIKQSETEIDDKMDKVTNKVNEALNTKSISYINQFLHTCTIIEKEKIEFQAIKMAREIDEGMNQKWANEDVAGAYKGFERSIQY